MISIVIEVHRRGVLHWDLTSENFMVIEDEDEDRGGPPGQSLVLIDFGHSVAIEDDAFEDVKWELKQLSRILSDLFCTSQNMRDWIRYWISKQKDPFAQERLRSIPVDDGRWRVRQRIAQSASAAKVEKVGV